MCSHVCSSHSLAALRFRLWRLIRLVGYTPGRINNLPVLSIYEGRKSERGRGDSLSNFTAEVHTSQLGMGGWGGRRSHQQSSQNSLPPASRLNGILNMAALTLRAAIKHLEEVPYLIPFASAALHWKQALSPAVAQKQMSVCPVKASFIHLELVRVCFNENWLLIGWFYFLPLCWRNESTTRIDYAVRFTATPT